MRRSKVLLASLAVLCACRRAPEEAPARVAVTAAPVTRGTVEATVTLEGRLVPPPDRDATLAPLVAGRLEAVNVREGEAVKKGSPLALVDRRAADEALASARAAREAAGREEAAKAAVAATTRSLFEKGIASKEERDADGAAAESARAARLEADAKLAQAERQAGFATLAAPFDGVVAQVLRHAGELVDGTPATPVVRVVGTERPEVAAEAAAADLPRLVAGQTASVSIPGGLSLAAHVARVPRVVDPSTSLAEVRLRLDAPSAAPLLSAVKASIVVERREGVLVVPPQALRRSEMGSAEAVVVEKGVCRVRAVTTGLVSPGGVEILTGLAEGESLVVDSPLGLSDGAAVDVRSSKSG